MQAAPPPLLPLLRSRLQAELLTVVLLAPEREWSLTELAERVGSSLATAGREVTRAEQAGVVTSRRVGSARLVRAASSPLTGPLTELLLRSFGPRQVVAEELADVPGVERAFLSGRGRRGMPANPAGRRPTSTSWWWACRTGTISTRPRARRPAVGPEVNVTVRSPQWWDGGQDGFHAEVTARPLVPVLGAGVADHDANLGQEGG